MERFIVTKFMPLETRQKRSKRECTEAVLKHLRSSNAEGGTEFFRAVYPFRSDNPSVDKRQVFAKFYGWSLRHPDDYWVIRGYVVPN